MNPSREDRARVVFDTLTRTHMVLCRLEQRARAAGELGDVEALALADALVLMARDDVKRTEHLGSVRLLEIAKR